jgi:hypothetical protein
MTIGSEFKVEKTSAFEEYAKEGSIAAKYFFNSLDAANLDYSKYDRVPEDKATFANNLEAAFSSLSKIKSVEPKFFESSENLR